MGQRPQGRRQQLCDHRLQASVSTCVGMWALLQAAIPWCQPLSDHITGAGSVVKGLVTDASKGPGPGLTGWGGAAHGCALSFVGLWELAPAPIGPAAPGERGQVDRQSD